MPPVLILETVDSTNAEARRRAEAGETGPLWIAARRQSEGRGRRGRRWESDSGNLAATLLMRTARTPAEAAQVTFVAALAAAEMLDGYAGRERVSIKWPNDVMLDGVKVAGILVESGVHASGGLWLAVGIGINLAHAPEGTERPATAIGLAGTEAPAFEAALGRLVDSVSAWQARWDQMGFQPVLDAWTDRTRGLNGPCVARLGSETLEGTADGVEADGALRLRLADGTLRRISAGDVFFGEAA
ncbi:biotin--[acetyl-CoA-carboxylase] ligase [Brevundimonas sp. PAMC22021]|nr:biotin--[acetyl-CoA-carboxylase] ligase [Brevundimonas sp. PAMC22021]